MRALLREFQAFLNRGNVIDLAVAVIIGAAFNAIVTSLVDDIITPLLGIFLGGVDFSALSITVGSAQVMYGDFIQAVINFLLTAWVIFMLLKVINRFYQQKAATPTPPSDEAVLLAEIRDLLKREREAGR